MGILETAEGRRVQANSRGGGWRRWGPYVSDRQWGTVREDYSADGDAWSYFPHDHARSRAYRWGEDAIAGFCDERQSWCLGIALWNGHDAILKERLFGLTNAEGNHGEDVKESYAYVDAVPSNAYLRMLYRYPQAAFPYDDLLTENARRTTDDPEYELEDTGVFDEDRFFGVTVEYAKASPDDILMAVTVTNHGPDPAPVHVVPQLWARNTWSWVPNSPRPLLSPEGGSVLASHPRMRPMRLSWDGGTEPAFCENETNVHRLWGRNAHGPFKDGLHELVVHGRRSAVSRAGGTKCGLPTRLVLAPGESRTLRLRFRPAEREAGAFDLFDEVLANRRQEADEFYAALHPPNLDPALRTVQRQALAGMIWSKQFYRFDVRTWLDGDPAGPPPPRGRTRDDDWRHLNNFDIISMPDKWEYPWYAAWDLAFHCMTFASVDPEFAKHQLVLILREWYMHPNGQIPAYEWNFGDTNPPVHAWAAWRVFDLDRQLTGTPDHEFLKRVFHKLLINFTWWVNRKDADGRNVFQGGFLGLDNIGVFDRSKPLPTGGTLDQADGTAWMAMYTLNLLRIALELAGQDSAYEDVATKFFEHFLFIAESMAGQSKEGAGIGLWDEDDGFFYDLLRLPDGTVDRMRVRSMVGLIPLMAVEVMNADVIDKLPDFSARMRWFLDYRPDLAALISRWAEPGMGESRLLAILRGHRMKLILRRMLHESEFLSDYGVRSLSRSYKNHPYRFEHGGQEWEVAYMPAESRTRLFGGNSNWRGPVWFPVNALLIESLQRFHDYYGDGFTVECPVGSGRMVTLADAADELRTRLIRLFQRPPQRVWPGETALCFHEYFDGDTGKGLGASHQTGWTGLIAHILTAHAAAEAGRKPPDGQPTEPEATKAEPPTPQQPDPGPATPPPAPG